VVGSIASDDGCAYSNRWLASANVATSKRHYQGEIDTWSMLNGDLFLPLVNDLH